VHYRGGLQQQPELATSWHPCCAPILSLEQFIPSVLSFSEDLEGVVNYLVGN
jgi:hypothetical protein